MFNFTLFKKPFSGRILFSAYALAQVDKAYDEGSYSRSANYLTAIRSFVSGVGDARLRDISKETILRYQHYLKARGISPNTVSCYNRSLRAIYNRAVGERLVSDAKPFADAFTGRKKTTKRSVGEDCVMKLREVDLGGNRRLELARDFFLFSFYTMGMPFVDIAYLRQRQISGNMLVYDRRKTGTNIRVPLTPDALRIIEKYRNPHSPYAFPILTTTREPDAYHEYCKRLNTYNRSLKALAARTGIGLTLSSYTMRHSWASIAYRSGVPLNAISQALGHSRPDITMVYIRELDDGLMRMENEKVQSRIEK